MIARTRTHVVAKFHRCIWIGKICAVLVHSFAPISALCCRNPTLMLSPRKFLPPKLIKTSAAALEKVTFWSAPWTKSFVCWKNSRTSSYRSSNWQARYFYCFQYPSQPPVQLCGVKALPVVFSSLLCFSMAATQPNTSKDLLKRCSWLCARPRWCASSSEETKRFTGGRSVFRDVNGGGARTLLRLCASCVSRLITYSCRISHSSRFKLQFISARSCSRSPWDFQVLSAARDLHNCGWKSYKCFSNLRRPVSDRSTVPVSKTFHN